VIYSLKSFCSRRLAIGLDVPVSFLKHCLPGSSQHMKVLKKPPFSFSRPDQVKQLVTSIAVKENLVPEVAEEIVCLGLKGDCSLSLYKEVNIKGCDLFSAVYDQDRRIEIRRLDNQSKRDVAASRGGFSELSSTKYFPDWARHKDVSLYSSNIVCMLSETNLSFTIDRSTPSQIKTLEKEVLKFDLPDVDFLVVQGLLHTSKYLHVADPIKELSTYLHVSRERLLARITVRAKGRGYLPIINSSVFEDIRLDNRFLQVHEIGIDRWPIIDVLNSTEA
jgi:hypothetical protein